MATQAVLENIKNTVNALGAVDKEKLLRRNLGEGSLEADFGAQLDEIDKLGAFVQKYAPRVHDAQANEAQQSLHQIGQILKQQASRPNAEYLAQRDNFLTTVANQLNEVQRWKPFFAIAALEDRGFLADEGIREEYKRAVDRLKEESTATLESVRQEATKALEEAKKLADEIEARARRTATKISVAEAQKQFTDASQDLSKKVRNWGRGSGFATIALVLTAVGLMFWPLPTGADWTVALYHTLLRVLVLSAVGAGSAFCFRMLRAHMHMAEKNRHRVRVANSIESFVNAALEPQQRDLLLAKLAGEVIDFGESGIIRGERDEHDTHLMSADMLARVLATLSKR